MDSVEIEFEKEALSAVAHMAIERQTGERGLRDILENVMRDVMYEIPSVSDTVSKFIITKDVIDGGADPTVINIDTAKPATKKKSDKKAGNESA